jgi:predicted RNA binding protein YcfA (HicA-like mRNA interferase family)
MSRKWSPCKRQEYIAKLKKLGFSGPHPGGKHHFMRLSGFRQALPGNIEYPVPQLRKLLKQVEKAIGREISEVEWNSL